MQGHCKQNAYVLSRPCLVMKNDSKLKFNTKVAYELKICSDLELWSFVQVQVHLKISGASILGLLYFLSERGGVSFVSLLIVFLVVFLIPTFTVHMMFFTVLDGQDAKLHKDCLCNTSRTTNAVIWGIKEVCKNLEELEKARTLMSVVLL